MENTVSLNTSVVQKIVIVIQFFLKKSHDDFKSRIKIAILRNRHPGVHIGFGVQILGDPHLIHLGKDSSIDDGVILDLRFGGQIIFGERTRIRAGAIIAPYGGTIKFGNDCGVQHYSVIYGHGGLTVGNFVWIAAHCLVIPANHGTESNGIPIYSQPLSKMGIKMGNDIWVGGGAKILDGVVIGDGSVIAAGAVISKNVSSNEIVGGIPAKLIRNRMTNKN